jgi:hypothetical protein
MTASPPKLDLSSSEDRQLPAQTFPDELCLNFACFGLEIDVWSGIFELDGQKSSAQVIEVE